MEDRSVVAGKTPNALQERPDLDERLLPYWETFWTLHPSRPMGMNVGAIPVRDMIDYLRLTGLTTDAELRRGIRLVGALDSEWREWNEKNSK